MWIAGTSSTPALTPSARLDQSKLALKFPAGLPTGNAIGARNPRLLIATGGFDSHGRTAGRWASGPSGVSSLSADRKRALERLLPCLSEARVGASARRGLDSRSKRSRTLSQLLSWKT